MPEETTEKTTRQFDTNRLKDFISRYHLGGEVNNVKYNVSDAGELRTFFSNRDNSLLGNVSLTEFELGAEELGIYETEHLVKLVNVLEDSYDLELEKNAGRSLALEFTDDYKTVRFGLADVDVIPDSPEGPSREPEYQTTFNITEELTRAFSKGMSAVRKDTFSVSSSGDELKVLLGWSKRSNENTVALRPEYEKTEDFSEVVFRGDLMDKILKANKSVRGTVRISKEGLMKVEFSSPEGDSTYYMAASHS